MPILQLSVPGQETTSVMEFAPSSARPVALSAAPDVEEVALGHPAVEDVLLGGGADAARVLPADVGQDGELVGVDVAERERDVDGVVALLLLRVGIVLAPREELRVVVCVDRHEGRGLVDHLGRELHPWRGVEVGLRPVAPHLLLDLLAEGLDADAVDVELDARAHTVLAELVGAMEDADGGLGDLEVLGDGHEVVERPRDAGHDGGSAADADLEALLRLAAVLAVAELREEGEVVDVGDHVVVAAAGEGGLPLARERLRVLVADEVAGVGR